ncbi:MAG: S-adenosylmethionine:tRNA ribosyltransferase-isomerase, partial [Burkholderiales bacterium]
MPLHRSDFHYELPLYLIAQQPPAVRSASRLLCLDPLPSNSVVGGLRDARMTNLPGLLQPGDLLVFNDTRVIPARLLGAKDSGGRVEILIERLLGEREALAQVRASKAPRTGSRLHINGAGAAWVIEAREGEFFRLRLEGAQAALPLLERA